MIRFACQPPANNINFILNEGLDQVGFSPTGTLIADPSIQISREMITARARRIPSPALQFLTNVVSSTNAAKGKWNLQGKKFKKGGVKIPYTWVEFRASGAQSVSNIAAFEALLASEISKYCGFPASQTRAAPHEPIPHVHEWPDTPEAARQLMTRLFRALDEKKIGYVFVISTDRKWYSTIKTEADKVGVQTTLTLRKPDGTVKAAVGEVANLVLKFNLKAGSDNWIPIFKNPILHGKTTMFMGIDVIHPGPGGMEGAPSVAGLVASKSPDQPFNMPGDVCLLHPIEGKKAVEMIPTLDRMVETRFRLWQQHAQNQLPEQIIVYRDGVGDSQLEQCLDRELSLIEGACKRIYLKQPQPKIFFQTVQKRHHQRFYQPKGDKSGCFDLKGNPLPGLIVDRDVISTQHWDWYGISHKTLQGTSRPAKHIVIYDSIGVGTDHIQKLTNDMGFVFGRATTPISVPSPARLADLLCERAKHHLYEVYFPLRDGMVYNINNHFKGQSDINPKIRDTMYYI